DGIRDFHVTGVQTCALPISAARHLHAQERTDPGTRPDSRPTSPLRPASGSPHPPDHTVSTAPPSRPTTPPRDAIASPPTTSPTQDRKSVVQGQRGDPEDRRR